MGESTSLLDAVRLMGVQGLAACVPLGQHLLLAVAPGASAFSTLGPSRAGPPCGAVDAHGGSPQARLFPDR